MRGAQVKIVIWADVDDLAEALFFLMENYSSLRPINIGSAEEISIMELAHLIKDVVGFHRNLTFDTSKPDGTPRKILDSSRVRLMGWKPRTKLRDGFEKTYKWFRNNETNNN
jgi:GDP-L-fucose synthase